MKEDRDGRREVERRHGWYMRYIHNVAWSWLFQGHRYGTREGYFSWTIWRVPVTLSVSIKREYPCGCWESWVLWDVRRHRVRLFTLGNHDFDAEEFRRLRSVA